MAESADQCCQALIRQSASHRLMPVLVAAAVREKNSKIRGLCCGYVALVCGRDSGCCVFLLDY